MKYILFYDKNLSGYFQIKLLKFVYIIITNNIDLGNGM